MKNILAVMKFTIKDMARRKSFIISTLLILVMIIIGFNVPNIIKAIQGENLQEKMLISDNDNVFNGNLEMLKQADLGYDIEITNSTYDEIKEKIENEEIDSAMIIEKADEYINIRYRVKNVFDPNTLANGMDYNMLKRYYGILSFTIEFTEIFVKSMLEVGD